jgi:hypothetical protein
MNTREVQDRCRYPEGTGPLGEVAQNVFAFCGRAALCCANIAPAGLARW